MSDDSDGDYSGSESGSGSECEFITKPDNVCKLCGRKFCNKYIVIKHEKSCGKQHALNKCMWCGLQFTNRGNLATHAYHIHGDSSYKIVDGDKDKIYHCSVCSKSFKIKKLLTYHIRRHHFNLQAKIPYAERKKVNQVWFEKVLNSNKILEIKKTSECTLIMRSLDENTGIKVADVQDKVIDLRKIYPTDKGGGRTVTCELCQKIYQKRNYKKHFEEIHLNKKKMHCNNCNQTFKRAYQYLKHRCHVAKHKGIKHGNADTCLRIASVESLSIPLL